MHFGSKVKFFESIDEQNQMLLFDPQTSGGLLLGVPQEKLDGFIARARELNQAIWVVGRVETGAGITVR
jgi:selenide,water dikinase